LVGTVLCVYNNSGLKKTITWVSDYKTCSLGMFTMTTVTATHDSSVQSILHCTHAQHTPTSDYWRKAASCSHCSWWSCWKQLYPGIMWISCLVLSSQNHTQKCPKYSSYFNMG